MTATYVQQRPRPQFGSSAHMAERLKPGHSRYRLTRMPVVAMRRIHAGRSWDAVDGSDISASPRLEIRLRVTTWRCCINGRRNRLRPFAACSSVVADPPENPAGRAQTVPDGFSSGAASHADHLGADAVVQSGCAVLGAECIDVVDTRHRRVAHVVVKFVERLPQARVPADLRADRDEPGGRHDEVPMVRRADQLARWIGEGSTGRRQQGDRLPATSRTNLDGRCIFVLRSDEWPGNPSDTPETSTP